LLGRNPVLEGDVDGRYWIAYANENQKKLVQTIFNAEVTERWSEFLFTPELRLTYMGIENSMLGRLDAHLSNNQGFLRWFARQHSFHCQKL